MIQLRCIDIWTVNGSAQCFYLSIVLKWSQGKTMIIINSINSKFQSLLAKSAENMILAINSWTVWTVYYIQNPEGQIPKCKHKHINTWWLLHTKHTKGNKIEDTWTVITWFNISLIITVHTHHTNILALTIRLDIILYDIIYYINYAYIDC